MATSTFVPTVAPERGAIPPALLIVCFVLCVINASLLQRGFMAHWWIFDENGLGIPTDFVNVWSAGRLVLDGHPAQAYDWDIQKQVQVAVLGQDGRATQSGQTNAMEQTSSVSCSSSRTATMRASVSPWRRPVLRKSSSSSWTRSSAPGR